MKTPEFSAAYERTVEAKFANDDLAHELLAAIDAEFRTDPMSVQCFDLRLVARVRECVAMRAELKRKLLLA